MRKRLRATVTGSALAGAGALIVAGGAGGALAAFPGTNGKIAFVHNPATSGSNRDIFTMDPDGQNRIQLTNAPDDDFDPSYSADGEKIVFARDPQGTIDRQIWVMSHDGANQTQITSGLRFDDSDP